MWKLHCLIVVGGLLLSAGHTLPTVLDDTLLAARGATVDCGTPGLNEVACEDDTSGGCPASNEVNRCEASEAGSNDRRCKPGTGNADCQHTSCKHTNQDTVDDDCNAS
jgi:hypothetical protein